MTATRRWAIVLAPTIVAVLIAGVVVAATHGSSAAQPRARAAARVTAPATPSAPPAPSTSATATTTAPARAKTKHKSPSYLHPLGHVANPKPYSVIPPAGSGREEVLKVLTHPAHEAWSRLLVAAPAGSRTAQPPMALTGRAVSKEFSKPAPVLRDLRFNGFSRGVIRTVLTGHLGDAEELWQFHRPAGSGAWYLAYLHANQPGPGSEFGHTFAIGRDGARGYTSAHRDKAGYHFGVAVALEGDMMVHLRLFSTAAVTRSEIASALRRALPPVARDIKFAGEFARGVLNDGSGPPPLTT
jgi:hypothetical protein